MSTEEQKNKETEEQKEKGVEELMDKNTPKPKKPENLPDGKAGKKSVVQKLKKAPKKKSKRYSSNVQTIDKEKSHAPAEAIALAKKTANTKFDGSIEAHFRLGIDVKKGDQQVRGTVSLPHGTGKTKTIAAFVSEANEAKARQAGADIVGGEELIQKIKQTGKIDFELAVTTPDMMPKLAVIAKVLGPKGLMPSPKNETIVKDVAKAIEELKKGKVTFKNDDTANVHMVIGKASFDENSLLENFNAIVAELKKAKPTSSKGTYIVNASINATMGPGIKVAV